MIPVPPSVLAYFTQFDVRTAIDLMSGAKDPKVPPTLRWDDVSHFYHARLAAIQTPIEYAMFLEVLWRATWSDAPTGWKPREPADPERSDLAIGPVTIWNEECFSRRFERGDYALELMVGLNADQGLQLGILLYDDDEEVVLNGDYLKGWERPSDYDSFWTEKAIVPFTETIEIEPFKRWTDQAWKAVEAALQPV